MSHLWHKYPFVQILWPGRVPLYSTRPKAFEIETVHILVTSDKLISHITRFLIITAVCSLGAQKEFRVYSSVSAQE